MLFFSLVLGALFGVHARAGVLPVADFDEGAAPLDIGAGSFINPIAGASFAFKVSVPTEPALGNVGSSLRINTPSGAGDKFILLEFGSSKNLTSYRALSFWVRGNSGGETFRVSLRSAGAGEAGYRPDIRNFLPGGVTTGWQKVVIPLRALLKEYIVHTSTSFSDINAIVFTIDPSQTFYVDDVLFHTKAAPVWVDKFDDDGEPGVFGYNSGDYIGGGAGASLAHVYDTAVFNSAPGGFKVTWTTGTAFPAAALVSLLLDDPRGNSLAADITGCDTLAFSVRGDSAQSGKPLGVALSDDWFTEKIHATTVTLTTSWQPVTRTVASFGLTHTTSVAQVQFWFRNTDGGKGPTFGNTVGGVVQVDDVRFLDTQAPLAPTVFLDDGAAVADGHIFGATNTLSITLQDSAADPSLEHVRLEHDGMTGGASWYRVWADTNTAAAAHSYTWRTSSLPIGSTYRVRLVVMDVAGNESVLSFSNVTIDALEDSTAPVISHAAIFQAAGGEALSIPVTVTDNKRISQVKLFYRAKGASAYAELAYALPPALPANYSGSVTIAAASVTSAGLEYYLSATDGANTAFFGGAASPQFVFVRDFAKEVRIGASGGTVVLGDSRAADGQTSVTIPPGALSGDVAVTIDQRTVSTVPSGRSFGRDTPLAAYEFGPDGTVFRKPVTLTLLYDDIDQDGLVEYPLTNAETGVNERDLHVLFYDGFDWKNLGGTVDPDLNTVSAQVQHFSLYALFPVSAVTKEQVVPAQKIITPAGSPGADDVLQFGGNPAGATIEIYDVTGRLIRRLEDQTAWDGRDDRAEIVEGGVYIYHAQVEGLKVTGTVTVAR